MPISITTAITAADAIAIMITITISSLAVTSTLG